MATGSPGPERRLAKGWCGSGVDGAVWAGITGRRGRGGSEVCPLIKGRARNGGSGLLDWILPIWLQGSAGNCRSDVKGFAGVGWEKVCIGE